MPDFADRAQAIVRTMQKIAQSQSNFADAALLNSAEASFVQTGYDNLDGGTDLWSLILRVPIEEFARIGSRQTEIEEDLLERLKPLVRTEAGNWVTEVVIAPLLAGDDESEVESADKELPQPSFWKSGLLRVFISHPSSIKDKAHLLKEALVAEGVVGFVAHDDIEPTREWLIEIESALRTMDALVALVTPDFVASKWCDQEVGIAIGRGKLIIPVRVGADPHGFLGRYQGLQAKGKKPMTVASEIAEILLKADATSPRMVEAIISNLEDSRSWARSRELITQLEKAKRIEPQQIDRLTATIGSNSEVAYAHTVPERIALLAEKFG